MGRFGLALIGAEGAGEVFCCVGISGTGLVLVLVVIFSLSTSRFGGGFDVLPW